MKSSLCLLVVLSIATLAKAQPIPVEATVLHQYFQYQHVVGRPFVKKSPYGWMHIANIITRYEKQSGKLGLSDELMNQFYLTYRLSPSFSLLAGGFYTNATKFRPSLALQWMKLSKDWQVVLAPRMDIWKKGNYELFGSISYRPNLSTATRLYTRLQFMTSRDHYHHGRSYQQFRLGLERSNVQFGLAVNFDEYGPDPAVLGTGGVFIRTLIF